MSVLRQSAVILKRADSKTYCFGDDPLLRRDRLDPLRLLSRPPRRLVDNATVTGRVCVLLLEGGRGRVRRGSLVLARGRFAQTAPSVCAALVSGPLQVSGRPNSSIRRSPRPRRGIERVRIPIERGVALSVIPTSARSSCSNPCSGLTG